MFELSRIGHGYEQAILLPGLRRTGRYMHYCLDLSRLSGLNHAPLNTFSDAHKASQTGHNILSRLNIKHTAEIAGDGYVGTGHSFIRSVLPPTAHRKMLTDTQNRMNPLLALRLYARVLAELVASAQLQATRNKHLFAEISTHFNCIRDLQSLARRTGMASNSNLTPSSTYRCCVSRRLAARRQR